MTPLLTLALGSFILAAVSLHKNNMPMFAMWYAIGLIQCALQIIAK